VFEGNSLGGVVAGLCVGEEVVLLRGGNCWGLLWGGGDDEVEQNGVGVRGGVLWAKNAGTGSAVAR